MGRVSFHIGCRFSWNTQVYELQNILVDGRYQLENESFGGSVICSQEELVDAWSAGDLRFENFDHTLPDQATISLAHSYTDFQALADSHREIAWDRYSHLLSLFKFYGYKTGVSLTRGEIEVYLQSKPEVSVSQYTLERWLKAFIASGGDIRSLVARTEQRGGKGGSRLHNDVEAIIQSVFAACRNEPQHRTPDMVYARILQRIADDNRYREANNQLKPPSRATFYRRLQQAGQAGILRRRPTRNQRQKETSVKKGVKVSRLLERVEIDHTPLDLFVVDLEDRLPIGRPTLTLATDAYSQMPFGFDVSFDPPSYLTVMRCLRHGILPKEDCPMMYDTVHPFPVYGLPETVIVDRGKEFVGHDLLDALGMLGVIREIMPPRTPWYKGRIERFFHTQNKGLLEVLPGYTFSNIFQRAGYNPQADACISLQGFKQLLHIFLLDIYAQRWHEGIQAIPAHRWEQSCNADFPPTLYPDARELRILLCASEERPLTRQGIAWETLTYNSAKLVSMRAKYQGERIRFRYDPDDIGVIYIFDADQGWLSIPCLQAEYAQGLSLYKHRVIRQSVLDEKRKVDILSLAQARLKLQQLVAEEFALTRKIRGRKQALRFLEGDVSLKKDIKSEDKVPLILEDNSSLDMTGWRGDYYLPRGQWKDEE